MFYQMKKFKLNFLFLLFFIPLFSISNICVVQANFLKPSYSKISEKPKEEIDFSNFLNDLASKGFETDRLKVDKIKKEDYDILAEYLMDPDVTKYLVIERTMKFYNINQAKNYVEFLDRVHTATFVLRLKDSKIPIGMLGFSFANMAKDRVINISYWLGKEYQNKGYAKEAIPMIVNEVFKNIGNFKFYIDFKTQNIASKKLADCIIEYITKNNSESSTINFEKFNCFRLDIEEYLISKKTDEAIPEKIAA